MTLTRKKISLIHVAKARLGLGDADYRRILWELAGVESSTDLDLVGFERVIEFFDYLGFRSSGPRAGYGDRPGMASARQIVLIRQLWDEYTDGRGTDRGLDNWLERTFHVSSLRFLPAAKARKAITALKHMKARREREPAVDAPA